MSRLIFCFLLSLISIVAVSQIVIQTDTSISKTVNVNDSFELKFADWPSVGQFWHLSDINDSTKISIQQIGKEVMAGYIPKGGKYVSTYKYKCLVKGRYLLKYIYEGRALDGELKKCLITIEVK